MAQITVYALSTCPYCKKAKTLLKELGADFEAIDVDLLPKEEQNKILEIVKKLADSCNPKVNPGFPTIVKGKTIIVGFNETKIKGLV
ncbi:glutaredoxin [Thermodesulfobium narugense DSM 14796]|uniref:Glutaredoxin n=1 Tax=Thermodesulfobium narugense DSM 14796 TaxID=747365 RepID=M1E9G3_9BACT|nr:glutaredoxin family protein [Thermodesulfobium narugense]AEE15229.1 glutaredoxin [Thermodesulfobium narugense DSM 14796]